MDTNPNIEKLARLVMLGHVTLDAAQAELSESLEDLVALDAALEGVEVYNQC